MKVVIRAEIVEVIRVIVNVGKGTEEDPARTEAQYWDKKGRLICKEDYVDSNSIRALA